MASEQLTPARMEAFSDGVIAVIITIMVLELKVPATNDLVGVLAILPMILLYLLSFVQVGIYWVNHHYLLDDLEYVSHGMLWANLTLLFFLSLVPFATMWVGAKGLNSFSAAFYAIVCALPAIAWIGLAMSIRKITGKEPAASFAKQAISSILYLSAIPAAWFSPLLTVGLIGVVAVMWIVPPARIVAATEELSTSRRRTS